MVATGFTRRLLLAIGVLKHCLTSRLQGSLAHFTTNQFTTTSYSRPMQFLQPAPTNNPVYRYVNPLAAVRIPMHQPHAAMTHNQMPYGNITNGMYNIEAYSALFTYLSIYLFLCGKTSFSTRQTLQSKRHKTNIPKEV